jgi:hypothetical protein
METPPAELVAFYGIARHHNLRMLRRAKAADFSKSAFHPELQRNHSCGACRTMGGHGAGHLQQIEKLKWQAGGK